MGSKTTQNNDPWKGAQPTLHRGLGLLNEAVDRDPFGANMFADRSQISLDAEEQERQALMSGGAFAGTSEARNAALGMLSGGNLDPIFQSVQSRVLPSVAAQFGSAGRTGSGAHQGTLTKSLTDAFAPFAQQNTFQAMRALPQLDQGLLGQYDRMRDLGLRDEQYRQRDLDAPYIQADRLLKAGGQIGGLGGTQTSSQSLGLGGIAQIAGLGLSLFSDRQLKHDIKRVGKTDGGVPIYTFRYSEDGPVVMGVMADEVPAEAVGEAMGFKTVDYARVA